jgi:hypothetical protein
MKKLIIALAALMVSISAYGQGQFVFNNRIPPSVTARFIIQGVDPADGSSSSIGGADWSVQLFGGPVGTPEAQLVALDPATTGFRGAAGTATAGYVTGVSPTVPGVAIGQPASVLIKVLGPNGFSQSFGPFTTEALGGGTATPPNLALGTSPLLVNVPEPTTLALGALGLGALLMMRRRK